MLCFSRNWSDPVQWSHYADRHKGICLGFDVPEDYVVPVTYTASRLPVDLTLYREENVDAHLPEMLRWFATKYVHWSYEREVRLFINLQGSDPSKLNFREFDEGLKLAEVILGPRCVISPAHMILFLDDLAETVDVYKARLAFNSFRVVRQRRVPSPTHLRRLRDILLAQPST